MGLNARNSDPGTSHISEDMLQHFQNKHIEIVYRALSKGPATQTEIAARTGLRPDQVWRRISDLKNKGLVFDTGKTKNGDSGRPQIVWATTMIEAKDAQLSLL